MKWETWFRGCCASVLTPGLSADGWFERKESGFGPFGSDICKVRLAAHCKARIQGNWSEGTWLDYCQKWDG